MLTCTRVVNAIAATPRFTAVGLDRAEVLGKTPFAMLSLRDLFSIRPRGQSRASFHHLDIHDSSQLGLTAVGTALVLTGALFRRSLIGLGMTLGGGALLFRTLAGKPTATGKSRALVHSINIEATPQEVFSFVRNLENAPGFLKGIESVHSLDERRSYWMAQNPNGEPTEWYLEIVKEQPGELIAWRSMEGSDVEHSGSVRFECGPDDTTEVTVAFEYHHLDLGFAEAFADAVGNTVQAQLRQDLGRLKYLIESRGADASAEPEEIAI
jgi:uncharacterized membrane protein